MGYSWSDGIPVLGELPAREAIAKLQALGDDKTVRELEMLYRQSISLGGVMGMSDVSRQFSEWWSKDSPWKYVGFEVGYIVPPDPTKKAGFQLLQSAREIEPDTTLHNATLNITLDRFFVVSYPPSIRHLGSITHRVLLRFYTLHQTQRRSEDIHFNKICKARDGEAASIVGSPIFLGLKVSDQGIVLGCESVKVTDEHDQSFLGFLESDAFTAGLQLLSTIQPIVGMIAITAAYITKVVAGRNVNAKVHEFEARLGLDKGIPSSYKLAAGSYVVVQTPGGSQPSWNWNDWKYQNGNIVRSRSPQTLLSYNYFIFGIRKNN